MSILVKSRSSKDSVHAPRLLIMANPEGGGGTGWGLTSLILLGDMLGLGALAIPSAFSRLGGFIPGVAVILVISCIATYSGSLYARLMSVPLRRQRGGRDAAMLDEVGAEALGGLGSALVYVFAYLLILLVTVLTTVTAVESLTQALDGLDLELSRLYCTLAVAGTVLVLVQVRKLANLGWVSIVGTAGMLFAIVVAILKLVWLDGRHGKSPKHGPEWAAPASLLPAVVAAFDIFFGFSGQQNWPRFITAMRGPRTHFTRAAGVAMPVIAAALLALGAVGYWKLGDDIDTSKPLTSILRQDVWAVAMNVGVLAHCIVATTLNLNTWVWSVMAIYFKTKNAHSARKRAPSPFQRLAADPEPFGDAQRPSQPPFATSGPAAAIEEGYGTGATTAVVMPGATNADDTASDPMRTPLLGDEAVAGDVGDAGDAGALSPEPTEASRWPWLVLSLVGMGVAGATAYFVPFFSELMGLVGAVGDVAVMMTLPALFGLILLPKQNALPRWEWWLLLAMVVVSVVGSALGSAASIWQMRSQLVS